MSLIIDALRVWGEVEWGGGGLTSTSPAKQMERPPLIAVRFKKNQKNLKDKLAKAIQSYSGEVDWEIDTSHKNWVIKPVLISEIMKEKDIFGDKDAAIYLAKKKPEFGIKANKELNQLALYLKKLGEEQLRSEQLRSE